MKKILLIMACVSVVFSCKKADDGTVDLFDGHSTAGWHNYNSKETKGWMAMDGTLMTHGNSGDLVTDKEYGDFELCFDFNVEKGGNSGIIYKVVENDSLDAPYKSGPEFQIIDDAGYADPLKNSQKTGANYDIHPPLDSTAFKGAGEWNSGKIIVNKGNVEHWLNDKLVAKYTYGTDTWNKEVAGSKFAHWYYATAHDKGKISLQDHGHAISFKNIKIKELK